MDVARAKGAPLQIAELVEHEQRVIAGAAEVTVVEAHLTGRGSNPLAVPRPGDALDRIRRRLKSSLSAPPFASPVGSAMSASIDLVQDYESYTKIAVSALKSLHHLGNAG